MLVAFCDQLLGNSTSACSKATRSPWPMRASRSSHSTASNGWVAGRGEEASDRQRLAGRRLRGDRGVRGCGSSAFLLFCAGAGDAHSAKLCVGVNASSRSDRTERRERLHSDSATGRLASCGVSSQSGLARARRASPRPASVPEPHPVGEFGPRGRRAVAGLGDRVAQRERPVRFEGAQPRRAPRRRRRARSARRCAASAIAQPETPLLRCAAPARRCRVLAPARCVARAPRRGRARWRPGGAGRAARAGVARRRRRWSPAVGAAAVRRRDGARRRRACRSPVVVVAVRGGALAVLRPVVAAVGGGARPCGRGASSASATRQRRRRSARSRRAATAGADG